MTMTITIPATMLLLLHNLSRHMLEEHSRKSKSCCNSNSDNQSKCNTTTRKHPYSQQQQQKIVDAVQPAYSCGGLSSVVEHAKEDGQDFQDSSIGKQPASVWRRRRTSVMMNRNRNKDRVPSTTAVSTLLRSRSYSSSSLSSTSRSYLMDGSVVEIR